MDGRTRPVIVILAAAVVWVAIGATQWVAARLLWVGLIALLLGWVALALYHRRKLAELHDLEAGTLGGWRRIHAHTNWPKACRFCGAVAHDWRSVRTHTDPDSSACAAYLGHLEAVERESETGADPARPVTVTVFGGGGAGAVDTLTAGDRPALEDGGAHE